MLFLFTSDKQIERGIERESKINFIIKIRKSEEMIETKQN